MTTKRTVRIDTFEFVIDEDDDVAIYNLQIREDGDKYNGYLGDVSLDVLSRFVKEEPFAEAYEGTRPMTDSEEPQTEETPAEDERAQSVAEVILDQLLKTWTQEFDRLEGDHGEPPHARAAKDVAAFHVIAHQLARLHARIDYLCNQLGASVTPSETASWLAKLSVTGETRTIDWGTVTLPHPDSETAYVQWVPTSLQAVYGGGRWRYTIHRAGNTLNAGWLGNDIGPNPSDDDLREAIRKFEFGFTGAIEREKDKSST